MDRAANDSAQTHELLEQARNGDRDAFERLFAGHRPYLRRLIGLRLDSRLQTRLDPSDVVQETHLEAFRRLPDYLKRRPMPFRLWLRKTAQERLLVLRRRHVEAARRAVGRELPLPDQSSVFLARRLLSRDSSPSREVNQQELAQRVRTGLALLSDSDREILIMRVYEGLSNQEVGQVLDLDPGTASKRHGRALLRLHKILTDSGLTESQA